MSQNEMSNRKTLSRTENRRLRMTDGVIPRAYGLTKIHKQNYPLRIIVSSLNSSLYNLSLFLHNIIADSIPEMPSFIKNSYDLINKLKM